MFDLHLRDSRRHLSVALDKRVGSDGIDYKLEMKALVTTDSAPRPCRRRSA
jgi:hypothetical protein